MLHALDRCLDLCDRAAEAARLLEDYVAAQASGGAGISRHPAVILRDLQAELLGLRHAANAMHDEIERALMVEA
jgi:hypothetical protein